MYIDNIDKCVYRSNAKCAENFSKQNSYFVLRYDLRREVLTGKEQVALDRQLKQILPGLIITESNFTLQRLTYTNNTLIKIYSMLS